MPLDFSKMDRLAYRDFDTLEAQQTRDDLIEKGFTVVEDKANPFTGTEGPQQPQSAPPRAEAPAPSTPPRPSKKPPRPFKSADGLDYRALYGDVFRWHEKYNALVLQNDTAWAEATDEMTQLWAKYEGDNYPFVQELLIRVFEEIERNAKAAQGIKK